MFDWLGGALGAAANWIGGAISGVTKAVGSLLGSPVGKSATQAAIKAAADTAVKMMDTGESVGGRTKTFSSADTGTTMDTGTTTRDKSNRMLLYIALGAGVGAIILAIILTRR